MPEADRGDVVRNAFGQSARPGSLDEQPGPQCHFAIAIRRRNHAAPRRHGVETRYCVCRCRCAATVGALRCPVIADRARVIFLGGTRAVLTCRLPEPWRDVRVSAPNVVRITLHKSLIDLHARFARRRAGALLCPQLGHNLVTAPENTKGLHRHRCKPLRELVAGACTLIRKPVSDPSGRPVPTRIERLRSAS